MELNGGNDDLDEDIHRLQIILQDDEEKEAESDAEGELQSLHQDAEDEHRSYISRSRPSTCSDVTASSYPPTSLGPDGEDRFQFLDPNNINPESCLAMNRAYQEVLLDLLRQTEMSLNENRLKQKELEAEIEHLSSGSKQAGYKNVGKTYASLSIPYFRSKTGECPPDNADVQAKKDLQEGKQHVRPLTAWSKFARKKLITAVAMDTLEKMLRPVMSRLELETEKLRQCRNQEEIDACKDRIETLQEEIAIKRRIPENELIQNLDPDKVDWMKIAVTGFDNRMDAADCERTWKNILRPEINRDKWTEEEDTLLQGLVEKYNMRNWATIAKELGTNRTPFQCLQHYQQHSMVYDSSPWTPEEDDLLKEVVETCKYGKDTVHFHQVAYYIDGRSAVMCRKRWEEINPQKKKGRWTEHEDCLLMAAIQMFGNNNWLKVAELVPTRNVCQCRERWINVLCPELRPKTWTYEEDKELVRLVQEHGPNWAYLSSMLPGRTDNNLLQRYRRLMTWKQQCEDFFAMPEKVQKSMMLGQKELEKKMQAKGKKKCKFRAGKKPNVSELKWYKKDETLQHYSDVGFLAQQIGYADEVYKKIAKDRQNNELAAPRPLPINQSRHRNNLVIWKRKCHLQTLVEAEIKKVISETKEKEYVPKDIADQVASSVSEMTKDKNTYQIRRAMKNKDPSELTVRELLKISRSIKETGRVMSDTDDEPDVKEESDDSFDESEIVGTVEEKPKKVRPMNPEHKRRLMAGREMNQEMNRMLQKMILTKHKRNLSLKPSGKHQKYRLFSKKVFKNHGSTEEQDKLRRKSLLLMLKSMDVDSVQAFKRARKRFKKNPEFLNLSVNNNHNKGVAADRFSADNSRHSLRHKSRSSFKGLVTRSSKRKADKGETIKLLLEVGKDLNVPEDDSDNEEDDVEEVEPTPRKKRKNSHYGIKENTADNVKTDKNTSSVSEKAQNNEVVVNENPDNVGERLQDSQQTKDNVEIGTQEKNSMEIATDVQIKESSGTDTEIARAEHESKVTDAAVQKTIAQAEQSTENQVEDLRQKDKAAQKQERHVEENPAQSQKSVTETDKSNTHPDKSVSEAPSTELSDSSKEHPHVQPYSKKLPFIPPNHTNLLALKNLLLNKEKLLNKAADDFKLPELKKEFIEKPRKNVSPFVRTLLSVINPDKEGIKKRGRRKLSDNTEKNSFFDCMDSIKKSREFNQLKARFCAVFTWPALISTIKPPKDGQLFVPGSAAADQSAKDSEKENYENITIKKEPVDSSDESSESESETNAQMRHRSRSSQTMELFNVNNEDVLEPRKRREYGGQFKEMVPLVYRDLEEMGDVELTDKEEMEIIVMNIITRRYGDKKKEISRAAYNRERGKTLRRLGMLEKMRRLEEQELRGEETIKREENWEISEAEQAPKPKKKKIPRQLPAPVEPRRSTRLSHHKPLETHVERKRKHHKAVREYPTSPDLHDDTEVSIQENNITIQEDNVTTNAIYQDLTQLQEMINSYSAIGGLNSTAEAAPSATSETKPVITNVSTSFPESVTSSSVPSMILTVPKASISNGSSSTEGASTCISAPPPLIFMSPAKPLDSSLTPSTVVPAVSTPIPLMFAAPGLPAASSAVIPGMSDLGMLNLPLLPSMGLPTLASSSESGTGFSVSGLTLPILPPNSLPVTTANSASAARTIAPSVSSSTASESSISSSMMMSVPGLSSIATNATAAGGTTGTMNFQGTMGNNLVPMVFFINPEQLGMANLGNMAGAGMANLGNLAGAGMTTVNIGGNSMNLNATAATTIIAGKCNDTETDVNSDRESIKIASQTIDTIKTCNTPQVTDTNKDFEISMKTANGIHDKNPASAESVVNDVNNDKGSMEVNENGT